jgi:hypothetical protein
MMLKDPKFPDAIIYNDANFTRKGDSILPQKLLIIGYLYCHFSDAEEHANDMWLLINPRLNENITKASVKEFVEDLFYVAVDQRLSIYFIYKNFIFNRNIRSLRIKRSNCERTFGRMFSQEIRSFIESIIGVSP